MRATLRGHTVATTEYFVGEAGAEAYWTLDRFLAAVEALHTGTTEMMCHPGEPPSQVVSGYSLQRRVELETFTSPEARTALERAGVLLEDYSVLAPGAPFTTGAGSRTR
jgi:hypothetical protein